MYFASISVDGRECVGLRHGDRLVDLAVLIASQRPGSIDPPKDMLDLISRGEAALQPIREMAAALGSTDIPTLGYDQVRWRPPVRRPGKIVGVAMNNSASDSRKISAPDHPMFFLKPASCLLGHREDIEVREYYGGVHPEPELAVVIGRRARDLDPRTAEDAVFGYTIMNDLTGNVMRSQDMVHYYALYASAADPTKLERREQHLSYAARYKGTDGFGPIGPWLATRDEIADPNQLDVTCSVGGQVVAEDSTRYLTYGVGEILAFLSRFQTLEPGDIISMGTAFRPKPGVDRSIHTADLQRFDGPVEVSISGLGTLSNGVRRVAGKLDGWRLPKSPAVETV
jgi:2-keto-4-pentenoate hydratase/2-oxohepta-3-ene-1,7-dioic acid hydratase in catechol pathway